jgi:hypothetical protein
MPEHPLQQSAFSRAKEDTALFRHSTKSFWLFEIIGVAMFGLGGGYLGYDIMPLMATSFDQFIYPSIGAVVGIILGATIVFGFAYLWNLFRAPYKQRNEARVELIELKTAHLIISRDGNSTSHCLKLAVSTNSSISLNSCYAKLVSNALKEEQHNAWVDCSSLALFQNGYLFKWQENNDDHVTIAGNGSKSYVCILESYKQPISIAADGVVLASVESFGICTKDGLVPIRIWGTYKLIIEFGTHDTKNPFKQIVMEMEVKVESPQRQDEGYRLELLSLIPYQTSVSEVV